MDVEGSNQELGQKIAECHCKILFNIVASILMLCLAIVLFLLSYDHMTDNNPDMTSIIISIVIGIIFLLIGVFLLLNAKNSGIDFYEYGCIVKGTIKKESKRIAYDEIGKILLKKNRVIAKNHTRTTHNWEIYDHQNKMIYAFIDAAGYVELDNVIIFIGRELDILVLNEHKDENAIL